MLRLCVRENFEAAHYIEGHPKCNHLHGHTYMVELMIETDADVDMVIDFGELKASLKRAIADYDHKLLNDVMGCIPTTENLAKALHKKLSDEMPQYRITVRVWEGIDKWAEYTK
ncbi:MAG: hypothetical protein RUDDFDWM_001611 [Candidatus Fervidibacterota bacterium]